jgi:hypothetical protein
MMLMMVAETMTICLWRKAASAQELQQRQRPSAGTHSDKGQPAIESIF